MPLYRYTALDEVGRSLRGQMEASNEAALEAILRKQGQWLTEARARAVTTKAAARPRGNRAVSRRVLIEFFLQTGLQLRSGVSLVDALGFGLEDEANAAFQSVQREVLDRVKAGSTFSEALTAHPRTFAPLVVNLI